jgi:hypothetical protein
MATLQPIDHDMAADLGMMRFWGKLRSLLLSSNRGLIITSRVVS